MGNPGVKQFLAGDHFSPVVPPQTCQSYPLSRHRRRHRINRKYRMAVDKSDRTANDVQCVYQGNRYQGYRVLWGKAE